MSNKNKVIGVAKRDIEEGEIIMVSIPSFFNDAIDFNDYGKQYLLSGGNVFKPKDYKYAPKDDD